VTPEQSRAARAWLNWSQRDLAVRANVSKPTVLNFEIGRRIPHRVTLTAMRTALEQGGVRFLFVDELAVGIIRADVETGARRIADSFNFKENHAPEKTDRPDYPRVTINEARPGRTTTPAELEQLGLVAPNETISPLSPVWRFHRSESEVTWADVEAVKLPFIVNGRGRRLYPNSKRALIIRATIALLKKQESAHLDKIFETLRTLEIDVTRSILGTLLSEFKGLVYIYRGENGRCFRMVNE
jgi:transcriptional regulator with XRE-family HTH domain